MIMFNSLCYLPILCNYLWNFRNFIWEWKLFLHQPYFSLLCCCDYFKLLCHYKHANLQILSIQLDSTYKIWVVYLPFPSFSPSPPLPTSSFLLPLCDFIFCWVAEMWASLSLSFSLLFCPPLWVTCSYYRFNFSVHTFDFTNRKIIVLFFNP